MLLTQTSDLSSLNSITLLRHALTFFPIWKKKRFLGAHRCAHFIYIGQPHNVAGQNLRPERFV